MQFVPDQVMGYDRAITMFSPDGRLLQVEYAQKAVSQGSMALGVSCKSGVILMADRARPDKLVVQNSTNKIFKIEKHISSTAAGYICDARVLVKKCRLKAQQYKLTYGEEIDTESIIKYISDLEQAYTQYGGVRPFGVSFLIGGFDKKGSQLYIAEPTGTYFQYKAKAIGSGAVEANKLLEKNYKESMDIKAGIKLAISAFKKSLGKEFNFIRLETCIVSKDGVKLISSDELKRY